MPTRLSMLEDKLYYGGTEVEAVGLVKGFKQFLAWCSLFGSKIVLYAHNARRFDSRVFLKSCINVDLIAQAKEVILGFSDTLPVFKDLLPKRSSYRQSSVAEDVLKRSYNAHSALYDAVILQKLCKKLHVQEKIFLSHSLSVEWVLQDIEYQSGKLQRLPSLYLLIQQKSSLQISGREVAGSGLELYHLMKAFQRGGKEGLRSLLTE